MLLELVELLVDEEVEEEVDEELLELLELDEEELDDELLDEELDEELVDDELLDDELLDVELDEELVLEVVELVAPLLLPLPSVAPGRSGAIGLELPSHETKSIVPSTRAAAAAILGGL